MKKIIKLVLSILLVMPLFNITVKAAAYDYAINGTGTVNVSITNPGETKTIKFVPAVTSEYKVYSVGNKDTKATMYDADMHSIKYDDDSGDGENFLIEVSGYTYTAGEEYYLIVEFYGNTVTGSFDVYFEETDFYAVNPINTIAYGDSIRVEMGGSLTNDPSFTYEWYTTSIDYINLQEYETLYKTTNVPYLDLTNVKKSMYLWCYVDDRDFYFNVTVDNGNFEFIPDFYAKAVQLGSKATLKGTPDGTDLSGVTYYWYRYVEDPEVLRIYNLTSSGYDENGL